MYSRFVAPPREVFFSTVRYYSRKACAAVCRGLLIACAWLILNIGEIINVICYGALIVALPIIAAMFGF